MTKVSADNLTFPNPANSQREDDGPSDYRSKPTPRNGKIDGATASLPGDSNGDTRERLLRHLIRLHGLVS